MSTVKPRLQCLWLFIHLVKLDCFPGQAIFLVSFKVKLMQRDKTLIGIQVIYQQKASSSHFFPSTVVLPLKETKKSVVSVNHLSFS